MVEGKRAAFWAVRKLGRRAILQGRKDETNGMGFWIFCWPPGEPNVLMFEVRLADEEFDNCKGQIWQ